MMVFGQRFLEHLEAAAQRLLEPLLLRGQYVYHELPLALQFGVGAGHALDGGVGELGQERLLQPQVATAEVDGPAQDAAHGVAPLLVGGDHRRPLVADKERYGAGVLGHDAHGPIDSCVPSPVFHAGQLLDAADDGREQVGIVHGGELALVLPGVALEQGGDGHALQASAGIDVLRGQWIALLAVAEVGHEDQIPYLQEAVAALVVGLALGPAAKLRPQVVVDLGAGATGAHLAGEPVVVLLPVAADALRWQEPPPQVERLVVIEVDGGP